MAITYQYPKLDSSGNKILDPMGNQFAQYGVNTYGQEYGPGGVLLSSGAAASPDAAGPAATPPPTPYVYRNPNLAGSPLPQADLNETVLKNAVLKESAYAATPETNPAVKDLESDLGNLINTINANFNNALQTQEEVNVERTGETGALAARAGLIGSPRGAAALGEAQDIGQKAIDKINSDRASAITDITAKYTQLKQSVIQQNKANLEADTQNYNIILQQIQQRLQDSLAQIAGSGMSFEDFQKSNFGQDYNFIQAELGLSDNQMKALYISKIPSPNIVGTSTSGTHMLFFTVDPATKKISTTDIDTGYNLASKNYVLTPDGTLLVQNDKGNWIMAPGTTKGEFGKPISAASGNIYVPGVGFVNSSAFNTPGAYSTSTDNNPLNITLGSATQKYVTSGQATVKNANGLQFLSFNDSQVGMQAARDLLFNTDTYKNKTVDNAMRTWSNGDYGAEIVSAQGIQGNTLIRDLTPDQEDVLMQAMAQHESGKAYVDFSITPYMPSGDTGVANKVDPSTGLTQSGLYNAALEYIMTGKMPSLGLGSATSTQNKRNAVINKAGAILQAAGIDMPTVQSEYKAQTTSLNQMVPRYNFTAASANAALANMQLALDQSPNVPRTGSPLANRYIQWANGHTLVGNPELTKFEVYIYTAAREYAKVVSGSAMSVAGLTDSASKEAQALLNATQTPEAFQAAITAMMNDMNNVKSTLLTKINSTSGTIASLLRATDPNAPTNDFSGNNLNIGSGTNLKSQVTAKGYDYDKMKADGLTDDQIKQAIGL